MTDKSQSQRAWKVSDVRGRLQEAALELFRDAGYDRTTAAEIAARAGVTERTFFRYFADKREVLFDGEAMVREALTGSVAAAPPELGALDTLHRAFHAFQPTLEKRWSFAKPRHDIIAGTPALRERDLAKMDALTDALAAALEARQVPGLRAALAARAGMAAFVQASTAWLEGDGLGLGERIDRAFDELKALSAEPGASRRS